MPYYKHTPHACKGQGAGRNSTKQHIHSHNICLHQHNIYNMHLEYARKTAKDLAIRAAQKRNQFSRTNRPIMCVESTRIDLYIYMYIYVTNHIDGNVVWFSSFDVAAARNATCILPQRAA